MSKEKKGLPTWKDLGLQDLRDIPAVDVRLLPEPEVIDPGKSEAEALAILAQYLGLLDGCTAVEFSTPLGTVVVQQEKLPHIVEKRQDARERYINFALTTMRTPFEVWLVEYDDGSKRLAYIGVFSGSRHMLVVVAQVNGLLLWNFMHADKKSLNKHRHGQLLFQAGK